MKISLGISPCPNDTYIFDALINNKIDWDNNFASNEERELAKIEKDSSGLLLLANHLK